MQRALSPLSQFSPLSLPLSALLMLTAKGDDFKHKYGRTERAVGCPATFLFSRRGLQSLYRVINPHGVFPLSLSQSEPSFCREDQWEGLFCLHNNGRVTNDPTDPGMCRVEHDLVPLLHTPRFWHKSPRGVSGRSGRRGLLAPDH